MNEYKNLKQKYTKIAESIYKESGANLNRLIHHYDNRDIAFITAFRAKYSKTQNLKRNKELIDDLKQLRLSSIKVGGGYVETEGDEKVEVIEDSFMVIQSNPNISQTDFFNIMIGLTKKFDQDSVLISIINNGTRKTCYYNKDGQQIGNDFSKISLTDVEQYFSKIHSHKFVFIESDEIEDVDPHFKGSSDACLFYSKIRSLTSKN